MDLDVQAVQGSMDQLQLGKKPQLSSKARQRLSVKSRKKLALTATMSSSQTPPQVETREGRKVLTSRSVSPPPGRDRECEEGRVGHAQEDTGTPGELCMDVSVVPIVYSHSPDPQHTLHMAYFPYGRYS